jgi:pyruvate kinase
MKINKEKIEALIDQIDYLIEKIKTLEKKHENQLNLVCSEHKKSAKNLIHYLGMRSEDMRDLQNKLGRLGLSRFARAEMHVLASLNNSRFILQKMIDMPGDESEKSGLSFKRGEKILNKNTKTLLGYRAKGRRLRIMVTLPVEAAHNYALVEKFVVAGMNCARINCAAEGPAVWKLMVENVKKASAKKKRKITIIMDLAGPKIRTGKLVPGPKLIKYSPSRDIGGYVTKPAEIVFRTEDTEDYHPNSIPVSNKWLQNLNDGDTVRFKDNRGRDRVLTVEVVDNAKNLAILSCNRTSYISSGIELHPGDMKLDQQPEIVGDLPALPGVILLRPDDIITIHESDDPGEPARTDSEGNILANAHVSCTYPPVFKYVEKGEPVYFDDGKIRGIVEEVKPGAFDVRIVMAKSQGSTLRGDKGINLPETNIITEGMTRKDQEDLKFVAFNADVVSYSFVNSQEDVEELQEKMKELDILDKVGVVVKIETRKAYDNLESILLTAMKSKNVGVMIARGDLAIEAGWDNMGRIQKEMLAICSSAHLPVVWATQVLENLTKKGLPSRSEITDAVSALKAECVMLNKGPYIVQSIKFLDKVMGNMEAYQQKQDRMLPTLEPAETAIR